MRFVAASTIAVTLLTYAPAGAQVPVVGEGPIQVSLTGRLQTQFNTSSADSVYSTFELRRARLGVQLVIDEWIEGQVEANFAHGLKLEDAWMNLGFHPAFQLQVGQFKKPFSRIELISSSRVVPIERGLRIRGLALNMEHHLLLDEGVYVGRELGAQIHGTLGPLEYAAGVFNGSGQNVRDANDAKSYAGRLVLTPFDAPFEIGAAASYREFSRLDSLDRAFTEEGLALEVDAQWGAFRRPGLFVVVEAMHGENFRHDEPMLGAQGIVSWFQPLGPGRVEGIEPLFRASYGDASTDFTGNEGVLYTPGVNLYFHGRNRLMLNWDHYRPQHELLDAESAIRAQVQLYF